MLKILSKMKIPSVLLAISAIVPALYSAPAAAEAGSRVCGVQDLSGGFFVLTKVNKGDTSTCLQAISELGKLRSISATRRVIYMQTCEFPSLFFGGGNVDRICGGKYRWTRNKIDGNPYFVYGQQRQIVFPDGNRQSAYYGSVMVQYTKVFPEQPNFPSTNCSGTNEYGRWTMSCN
jgi:hypothetical protein